MTNTSVNSPRRTPVSIVTKAAGLSVCLIALHALAWAWVYKYFPFQRYSPLSSGWWTHLSALLGQIRWKRENNATPRFSSDSRDIEPPSNYPNEEEVLRSKPESCDSASQDIEGCITEPLRDTDPYADSPRHTVKTHLKKKLNCSVVPPSTPDHESPGTQVCHLPEHHLVYVKTFGCSHNGSDSEFMMGLLQSHGYTFTDDLNAATICLINSCTVKNPSQDALMTVVRRAEAAKKYIVVAGCVPQAQHNIKGLEKASLVGTTQITKILDVFEETLKGNRVRLLSKAALPSLDIPKVRRNKFIEIIPISSGCLGACTYCKTRYARGRLGSYSPDAILRRIQSSIEEGIQQVWLTSEDVGAYGIDLNTNIGILLHQSLDLLEQVECRTGKRIMLRMGMTNPPYMAKHIDAIVSALNRRNCFRFIHIPVQSGSNRVLHDMVREYTVEDFTHLLDQLLKRVSNVTVATDIICGFPHETASDHQLTLELISKYKFPIVNISQFYPRPGTPAAHMTRVPTQVVKSRSSEVSSIFRSYKCTDFLMDSYQRVWFTENNEENLQSVGHTVHYLKVVVDLHQGLPEKNAWVHITSIEKWQVRGNLLHPSPSVALLYKDRDELYDPRDKQRLVSLDC